MNNTSNNIWFFDRYGYPEVLLLAKSNRFVDHSGYNIGYIKDSKLYNYGGVHCGWIEGGVMRDLNGFVVGFMQGAKDFPSPIFPIPQIPPIPAIPQIPPIPAIPQIPKMKPIKEFGWSNLTPISIFQ